MSFVVDCEWAEANSDKIEDKITTAKCAQRVLWETMSVVLCKTLSKLVARKKITDNNFSGLIILTLPSLLCNVCGQKCLICTIKMHHSA